MQLTVPPPHITALWHCKAVELDPEDVAAIEALETQRVALLKEINEAKMKKGHVLFGAKTGDLMAKEGEIIETRIAAATSAAEVATPCRTAVLVCPGAHHTHQTRYRQVLHCFSFKNNNFR